MARKFLGWTRFRLTSPDCAARLRDISGEIRLEDVRFEDELSVSFLVSASDGKKIKIREGERLEVILSGGLPELWAFLNRWRITAVMLAALLAFSAYLPGRVLFLRVEGNDAVPERRILEEAEKAGLTFGADRREIRSEQLKNHLLWAIPELRWAGVNTSGCTATITVAERDPGTEPPEELAGDIVSVTDALVTGIDPQSGTAQVKPGQAVQAGQVLISGTSDLGTVVHTDRASGEVYGLTRREKTVCLPQNQFIRTGEGSVKRTYALLIGKKRVNFSLDSGILYGTCVKMRTVQYLTLPGGFTLPVALVTETYTVRQTETADRSEPERLLLDAARRQVLGEMTAGSIRRTEHSFDGTCLTAVFDCHEMIGAFRPGIVTEGDTNDRENGERGAG